jgi:hypothetical protein
LTARTVHVPAGRPRTGPGPTTPRGRVHDPMLVSHGDDTGSKRVRFSAEDRSQRRRGHGTAVWLSAF